MVEETGEIKVKHETSRVADHFRAWLQFSGFAGSLGLSQVIYCQKVLEDENVLVLFHSL